MPVGSILAFAGSKIPEDWLLCDGSSYATVR
ncbi:tail fiber protein [Flavobacterium lipolyticum]